MRIILDKKDILIFYTGKSYSKISVELLERLVVGHGLSDKVVIRPRGEDTD